MKSHFSPDVNIQIDRKRTTVSVTEIISGLAILAFGVFVSTFIVLIEMVSKANLKSSVWKLQIKDESRLYKYFDDYKHFHARRSRIFRKRNSNNKPFIIFYWENAMTKIWPFCNNVKPKKAALIVLIISYTVFCLIGLKNIYFFNLTSFSLSEAVLVPFIFFCLYHCKGFYAQNCCGLIYLNLNLKDCIRWKGIPGIIGFHCTSVLSSDAIMFFVSHRENMS